MAEMRWPTYLRVVITTRCPLRCHYCHGEGEQRTRREVLTLDALRAVLSAAVAAGVRKIKFLGGEPLVSPHLPAILHHLSDLDRTLDLSVITGGAIPLRRLDAAIAAGLGRANMTMHGYTWEAFRARPWVSGTPTHSIAPHTRVQYEWRQAVLQRLLEWGRPLKVNYVYRGPQDEPDLQALLDDLAGTRAVVGVLDDLGNPQFSHHTILETLRRLRGEWVRQWRDPDPHSLPTTHLLWSDGLRVEVKTSQLGRVAPWRACRTCPAQTRCREGIFALRLNSEGRLRTCMDRPDLGCDLAAPARTGDVEAVVHRWRTWVLEQLETGRSFRRMVRRLA